MKNKIKEYLDSFFVKYNYFEHEASGPSNLSREIRAKNGYPNAVGAKALILMVNFKGGIKKTILAVLPGHSQLNKEKFKKVFPEMQNFRFATKEELFELTGLIPGEVPPFANPILKVDLFVLDKNLGNEKEIGFNAGSLTASIVLEFSEYFKTIKPDFFDEIS